jgi:uncharacterized protein with FMN-binding domain
MCNLYYNDGNIKIALYRKNNTEKTFSIKQNDAFAPYIGGGFMKYLLILFMLIVICGCAALAVRYGTENGGEIYEGTGQGFRGSISVLVRLNEDSITEIEVIDSVEDRFVGGAAIEELIDLVIMYNSTDVDAVSGATESSNGFLDAVRNAILKR